MSTQLDLFRTSTALCHAQVILDLQRRREKYRGCPDVESRITAAILDAIERFKRESAREHARLIGSAS